MTLLKQSFDEFRASAAMLESEEGIKYDAKPYKDTIRKMLDGYCAAKDAGDERRKTLYVSGLMLRFWYVIGKLKEKCPGLGLDDGDFMAWLFEAIEYACKYRAWQIKPNVNAQQCVNQCIETIRKQHYYEFNLDKNRANYNTVSMATPMDDDGKTSLLDTFNDESVEEQTELRHAEDAARRLVQGYLNKRKIVEAIILDVIAFNDTSKTKVKRCVGVTEDGEEYKYSKSSSEFWAFKAIQCLSKLPTDYEGYFLDYYDVKREELNAAVSAIRTANNAKLYRYLHRTLKDARGSASSWQLA